jgi:hypothetical protein
VAAHAADLQDAATALSAQVRHGRAGELDGAGQIRGNQLIDVRVAELLGRPTTP